jgi:hypothetical protein
MDKSIVKLHDKDTEYDDYDVDNRFPIDNNNDQRYQVHRYRPRVYMEGTLILIVIAFVILLLIYYFFFMD